MAIFNYRTPQASPRNISWRDPPRLTLRTWMRTRTSRTITRSSPTKKPQGSSPSRHRLIPATGGFGSVRTPLTGFFIDTFSCPSTEAFVTLAPGEEIDIELGGWIYQDRTVQMQTIFQRLTTSIFWRCRANLLESVHRTGKDRAAIHACP